MKDIASRFLWTIPALLLLVGLLIVYASASSGRNASRMNTALNQVQLCILTKNARERSQEDIEQCYRAVENDYNVQLNRYDKL